MLSKNIAALQERVKSHYLADEIIKGTYWENGKGCAVGCSLHSGKHKDGEAQFGVPDPIWRLLDNIFESLPNKEAKELPLRFSLALRDGADYSGVTGKFLFWLVDEELRPWHGDATVGAAVLGVRDALATGVGLLEAAHATYNAAADADAATATAAAYAARATYATTATAAAATYACAATYTDTAAARKRQAEKLLALIEEGSDGALRQPVAGGKTVWI